MNGWQGRIVEFTLDGVTYRGQVTACNEDTVTVARWDTNDEVEVAYELLEAVKFYAA